MSSAIYQGWMRIRQTMYALDWYFILMIVLYSSLTLGYWSHIPSHWNIIAKNILFLSVSLSLIHFAGTNSNRWIHLIREFYVIPFIYPIYSETFELVPFIRTMDFDKQLIALDRTLFGVDPTKWISQFSHPVLTEYLQICYVAFFFLPSIHAIILFRDKRMVEFEQLSRIMVFSFFISYLAYFAFPAVGPRFTLHDFYGINLELPGVWVTQFLRERVNIGGGIVPFAADPASMVNRDCMPSGHTMLTLINIVMAWRFHSRGKWLFTIVGGSLIFATIYLRYHYTVDVLAGVICALFMFPLEPMVDRFLKRHKFVLPD